MSPVRPFWKRRSLKAALGTDDTINEVGINLMPLAGAVNNVVKVLPVQGNTCGLRWSRDWS
jgi:hypothetical protein